MNVIRTHIFRVLFALLIFDTHTCAADADGAQAGISRDSFRLVSERNIFDPNRRSQADRIVRQAPEVPPKIESFSLVGALLSEVTGTNAFFAGTDSRYNTVLSPGESIAGHTIVQLVPDSVTLETNENTINLSIGMQMKRIGEGSWQLIAGTANSSSQIQRRDPSSGFGERRDRGPDERRDPRSFTDNRSSVSPRPEPNGDSDSGDSPDDILKRLMERRRQELNQ